MQEKFTNEQIQLSDLPDFEEVNFQPVSKKLRTKSLIQLSILTLIFLVGASLFFMTDGFGFLNLFIVLLFVIFLGIRFLDVILKQKYYGYALREKDILFRKGYIQTQITIIPFNRIQHSAINRSFFDKLFGISSLKIFTAGGSGSDMDIPGLLPEIANELNSAVSKKVSENA